MPRPNWIFTLMRARTRKALRPTICPRPTAPGLATDMEIHSTSTLGATSKGPPERVWATLGSWSKEPPVSGAGRSAVRSAVPGRLAVLLHRAQSLQRHRRRSDRERQHGVRELSLL